MENDTTESPCVDGNSDSLKNDNLPPVDSEGAETGKTTTDSNSDTGNAKQAPVTVERQNSSASAAGSDTKVSSIGKDKEKINILLKPVGDAPILKQKLWAVPAERLVSQITEFIKKYLKLEKHQNLFIFVNQLFAPALDQSVRDLYECFGSDNKLVLHYSTTIAWG